MRGPFAIPRAENNDSLTGFPCAHFSTHAPQPVHASIAFVADGSLNEIVPERARCTSCIFPHGVTASRPSASDTGHAERHIFGQNAQSVEGRASASRSSVTGGAPRRERNFS